MARFDQADFDHQPSAELEHAPMERHILRLPSHQQDADMAWLQPRLVDEPGNRQWVWTLPARQLGPIKPFLVFMTAIMPWPPLAFMVVFQFMWHGNSPTNLHWAWHLFDWLPMLFCIPMALGILGFARMSWRFLLGSTTLALSDTSLEINDGLTLKFYRGFYGAKRRIALEDLGQLEIAIAESEQPSSVGQTGPHPNFLQHIFSLGALLAHPADAPALSSGTRSSTKSASLQKRRNQKPTALAIGYPPAWLNPLADAIAERLPAATHAMDADTPRVVQTDLTSNTPNGQDNAADHPVSKPTQTKITLEQSQTGLTFQVPPQGIWKGSKGMFGFAIMWLLITNAVGSGFAVAAFQSPNWVLVFPLGMVALFEAIGLGMFFFAIKSGRTRAIIDVVGQGEQATVLVNLQHPFGHKQHEWHASELQRVCMDATDTKVNDEPVMALYFHPMEGKKVGILSSHSNEELQWMAYEIRQAICLKSDANKHPNQASQPLAPKPLQTNITRQTNNDTLTLHAPATGITKGPQSSFFGALFFLLFSTSILVTLLTTGALRAGDAIIPLLILSVFETVGILTLFLAIKNGRTSAIIDVAGQGEQATVMVNIQHPFGRKQHEWHASELNRVCMDATGTKINDVPVMALYFHPLEGKKVGILSSRSNEELQWMASEIRQATGLLA